MLRISEIVNERYRVGGPLDAAGRCIVYRAWDMRLDAAVVVREALLATGIDSAALDSLRERLHAEARAAAEIAHPSLARVIDVFVWQGAEYVVTTLPPGERLSERIETQGAQPEARVMGWARELLDALGALHRQGVIHRDVRPGNVIITPEGRAVLTGLGLLVGRDQGPGLAYAPPEAGGATTVQSDARSDLYALAATLTCALTGQAPPTAAERLAGERMESAGAGVSVATAAALRRALAMALDERFASAEAMAEALPEPPAAAQPAAAGTRPLEADGAEGPAEERRPVAERRAAPRRRLTWRGVVLGGAALLLTLLCAVLAGGGLLWGWLSLEGERQPIRTVAEPTVRSAGAGPASVLLEDDFSSESSGWEIGDYEGGSVGYTGEGAYFVRTAEDGGMWGVANVAFSDVDVRVQATQVLADPTDNNAYGIGCRLQRDGAGYFLVISGDGGFAIILVTEDDEENLVDWTATDAVNLGDASNEIRAVCDGELLSLYANGQRLATAEDSTFDSGDVGFVAVTYETEPTEIHFDDVTVAAP